MDNKKSISHKNYVFQIFEALGIAYRHPEDRETPL